MQTFNKENKPFNVLVCVPSLGQINSSLVGQLIGWAQKGAAIGFITGVYPVERARNEMVKMLEGMPEHITHMLMVDADTIPPADALEKLLALHADIATGLTHIFHDSDKNNITIGTNAFSRMYFNEEKGKEEQATIAQDTGIQKFIRCGASCMLVKRSVFQEMIKDGLCFRFELDLMDNGKYKGEDYYFCDRAREAGYRMLCDTSVLCEHSKTIKI